MCRNLIKLLEVNDNNVDNKETSSPLFTDSTVAHSAFASNVMRILNDQSVGGCAES